MAKMKSKVRRRRPASQPYGPRREGVNTAAVAAGAAVGAIGGRAVARKTNLSRATRANADEMAKFVKANKELFGSDEKSRQISNAAETLYRSEYRKMPRVKDTAKLGVYRELVKKGESSSSARKAAGLSQKETMKFYNKGAAKYSPSSVADKLSSSAYLRHERTRTTAGRRGAVAGGITGAAISLIAQAVARELNKKKR